MTAYVGDRNRNFDCWRIYRKRIVQALTLDCLIEASLELQMLVLRFDFGHTSLVDHCQAIRRQSVLYNSLHILRESDIFAAYTQRAFYH